MAKNDKKAAQAFKLKSFYENSSEKKHECIKKMDENERSCILMKTNSMIY